MLEQVSVSIFGVDVWMNAARENVGFFVWCLAIIDKSGRHSI
jgi:hypothetical protein